MNKRDEFTYLLGGQLRCEEHSRDEIERFLDTHVLTINRDDDALTRESVFDFKLIHHGRVLSIKKKNKYFCSFIIADILTIGDGSDELYYMWS